MKKKFLITGGAGFFGSYFASYLADKGFKPTIFDRLYDKELAKKYNYFQGDFRNKKQLEEAFEKFGPFDAVFHFGAELAHCMISKESLWSSNVLGTKNVTQVAIKHKVKHFVFTSSNCAVGKPAVDLLSVKETDPVNPLELYGRSKLDGEKILKGAENKIHADAFRCPTIIAPGRLGLLTILFDFIKEGRKVWVVGSGDNKYQFIAAFDLAQACLASVNSKSKVGFRLFNIGSDNVKSLVDTYRYVVKKAKTSARIARLPKTLTLFLMKMAYKMGLSPLGPYHYGMIAENFIFNTDKIKKELNWKPTKTNEEILWEAYQYYQKNSQTILNEKDGSPHRTAAKMGIIKFLKALS